MKKTFILYLIFNLYFLSLYSQDIVYDELRGNKDYWLKISEGPPSNISKTFYENTGVLSKSKFLMGAGLRDGLEENTDYITFKTESETLIYEFKSNTPLNLIIYRYYYNDVYFYYFIGIRKAELGSNMFDGKYLLIMPMGSRNLRIKVYNNIGVNRELFYSASLDDLEKDLNVSSIDYQLGGIVTVESINGAKEYIIAKPRIFLPDIPKYDIKVWPNPTDEFINIWIPNNEGIVARIYNVLPQLLYEENSSADIVSIDVSNYIPGVYFLVISDYKNGNIIYSTQISVLSKFSN